MTMTSVLLSSPHSYNISLRMACFRKFEDIRLDNVSIIFLWLIWYACSSVSTLTNKSLLSIFPYPLTATTNQLLHTTLYGFLLSRSFSHVSIAEIYDEVKSTTKSFIILGFLNAATIAFFHFGLSLLSAAYIHISKYIISNI